MTPDKKGRERPAASPSSKKAKTDAATLKHIKLLQKTIQQYRVNVNMCQSLLVDIQINHEWGWANKEEVQQDIKPKNDNLEARMQ